MRLTLLKSKLHKATVTAADLHYEGSIALGPDLRQAAGLFEYERVEIYNITNGERFATYVIAGHAAGEVMINGAAARRVQPGDQVIIAAYAEFTPEEARLHRPTVVMLAEANRIASIEKRVGDHPVPRVEPALG
jgi:aspartate 1-decarboxylase